MHNALTKITGSSMSLSKLHVRFIQSQKNFYLTQGDSIKAQKLPIAQLYVKDTNSFYMVITEEPLVQSDNLSIIFKEQTHALKTLECDFEVDILKSDSEDFEDALLFFQIDENKVKQVLFLQLQTLKDA